MFHLVDDEALLRRLFTELMASFGHTVISFSGPHEYLAHMDSEAYQPPLAVFSDINMPGMNGYELMGQAQRKQPGLRFVMISAFGEFSSPYSHQACAYLRKPFFPETLQKVAASLKDCETHDAEFRCYKVSSEDGFYPPGWQCPHKQPGGGCCL